MEKENKVFKINSAKDAIEHLMKGRCKMPFNCPHVLVVPERMKHGSTVFEKGDILCKSNFLDVCNLFNRAKADEEGNVIARCCKVNGDLMVKFRNDQ